MTNEFFSQKKISQIFGTSISKTTFYQAEEDRTIPRGKRYRSGAINVRGWDIGALPNIGERWGFLPKLPRPICMSVFTTKGGVLKTSLTLNMARMAALHNIKTCVIGLDIQGDITTSLGHQLELEDSDDLQLIIQKLNETKGLSDVFNRSARLQEIILPTSLPTLFYIPETPELVALNESLNNINRREYWLKERIIDPLKNDFELIIMDCSPNWNRLITNALVSCDVLLSPLECKINNFRNFRVFQHFLGEFQREMNLHFESIFIPTRYSSNKKLTQEIRQWYRQNVSGCTQAGIRESVDGEEATAMRLSIPEHSPTKTVAKEMRDLLMEIHQRVLLQIEKDPQEFSLSLGDGKNQQSEFTATY